MNNLFHPLIQLATANLVASARFMLAPAHVSLEARSADLWRTTMQNQAQFAADCTDSMMTVLKHQRLLLTGHMEKLSQDTERVAAELAHTTVRAVAIATNVRRGRQDRRVFSLPLPADRRGMTALDRRVTPPVALQAGI